MRITLLLVVLLFLGMADVQAAQVTGTGIAQAQWPMVVVGWMFGAAAVRARRNSAQA